MKGTDDKDAGAAPELENQEDVATPAGVYDFLRIKKLTKEESTAPAVVQMMIANCAEIKRENARLRGVEENYNSLRVQYARLSEKVMVIGKASVFWDLVLILSPLFLGLIIDMQDLFSIKNLLVVFPLLLFIVAALCARYGILNKTNAESSVAVTHNGKE